MDKDNFLPAGYREAANCRHCFYSKVKNQHFRPAGMTRCTDSRELWHSQVARRSAWSHENFTPIG